MIRYSFFDIHSHFNLESFDGDLNEVIESHKEKNIGTICVGVDKATSEKALMLSGLHENIYACIGLHPDNVTEEGDFDREFYKDIAMNQKVVAIGECGLDYFRIDPNDHVGKDNQKKAFRDQIELALFLDLPLMLHIRPSQNSYDAYEEVLEILEVYKKDNPNLRGDSHFFVGTEVIADRFIALGFTVSFTGVITITTDYDELVRYVPLEHMMAETDAPYVAPVPYRGKRCEPYMVEEVYKKIADLKGISLEEVVSQLAENRKRMFGIAD
jgi:TatD DNase family protein